MAMATRSVAARGDTRRSLGVAELVAARPISPVVATGVGARRGIPRSGDRTARSAAPGSGGPAGGRGGGAGRSTPDGPQPDPLEGGPSEAGPLEAGVLPRLAGDGGNGVPHRPQKRLPGGFANPHRPQGRCILRSSHHAAWASSGRRPRSRVRDADGAPDRPRRSRPRTGRARPARRGWRGAGRRRRRSG
jgi:hypothetical protein